MDMPTKERRIDAPDGGWQECSWYVVDVAFREGNPIHRALFYTGFLNGLDGGPGGYNMLVNPSWHKGLQPSIEQMHYLAPVKFLCGALIGVEEEVSV